MTERRAKRTYTDEFKKQIVNLYNNGKKSSEIIKEYDLTYSIALITVDEVALAGGYQYSLGCFNPRRRRNN